MDDLISRREAINIAYDWSDVSVEEQVKRLNDLPSVNPIRPKGEWVLLDECSNSGYYCSNCHKKVVKEGWSDTVKMIKYCPRCGSYNGGNTDADSD